MRQSFLVYYRLVKPGIIYGNLLHAIAGILFAWSYGFSWQASLGLIAGTSLVIAAGCIVNNYFDRDIDSMMARTKNRELATGSVPSSTALILALVMLLLGLWVLYWYTNMFALMLGFAGFITYSFIYTFAKRHTPWSTLIGTIPGSIPIAAGYVTLSNSWDIKIGLLFILLAAWQMVHFYAIALFRKAEYAQAKVPVISVVRPERRVVWSMVWYSAIYTTVCVLLFGVSAMSLVPALLLISVAGWLLKLVSEGLNTRNYIIWARRVFKFSLVMSIVLLVTSILDIVFPVTGTLQ